MVVDSNVGARYQQHGSRLRSGAIPAQIAGGKKAMRIFAIVMSALAIIALMVTRDQPKGVTRDEIDDSWIC